MARAAAGDVTPGQRGATPPAVIEGYRHAPEHLVAEIIDGVRSLLPRPRRRRARGATRLAGKLVKFDDPAVGDPGGWVILAEPELRLGPHPDVLVPDIAGWRRERLPPDFLDESDALTLAPDWCCEVLSPSTERLTERARRLATALPPPNEPRRLGMGAANHDADGVCHAHARTAGRGMRGLRGWRSGYGPRSAPGAIAIISYECFASSSSVLACRRAIS